MTALELEIGELVVEGLLIERRDVHVASLVFGVADAAFLFRDASVVTLFLDGILGHILVTVEAQSALRAFLESVHGTSGSCSRDRHGLQSPCPA